MSRKRVKNRSKSKGKRSHLQHRTVRHSLPNSQNRLTLPTEVHLGDTTFTDDGFAVRWSSGRAEEFLQEESIEGFINGRFQNVAPGGTDIVVWSQPWGLDTEPELDVVLSLMRALATTEVSDAVNPHEIVLRVLLGTAHKNGSFMDFEAWKTSPNRKVRLALACCPHTPDDVLYFLMNDEDSAIRFAAFVNPNLQGAIVHTPRFTEADDICAVLANPQVSTQAINMALFSGHRRTNLLAITLGWDRISERDKDTARGISDWALLGEWMGMENASQPAIEARVLENLKVWRRFCDERPVEAAALLATDPKQGLGRSALRNAVTSFIFR